MEPAERALADLVEVSSEIESAVLLETAGTVVASTGSESEAATLAGVALDLLEAAAGVRADAPVRVHASFPKGAVFVVREGERAIAATTTPAALPALVGHDLDACLRRSVPEQPKRRRRSAKAGSNASA